MLSYTKISLLTLLVFTLLNISLSENSLAQDSTNLPSIIVQYQQDYGALSRKYTLRSHDYHFERFEIFHKSELLSLNEIPFEELDQQRKVDFLLLKNLINRNITELAEDKRAFQNIKNFIPAADSILNFIRQRRMGVNFEGEQLSASFNQWDKEVQEKFEQAKKSPQFLKNDSQTLSRALRNYQSVIEEAYNFYYGYDPDFTWWVEEPFKKLNQSFSEYISFVSQHINPESSKDDGSGIIGNPIGESEINKLLDFEMISYSPAELIDIANKQFAEAEQQMLAASRKLGYGDDWKAALEHVKETYVPEGEQPELIQELAEEAITFLEERDLVSIPELAKETWRMTMLSPERQRFAPFFLGGEVVQIAYPTNTMSHEAKMMSLRGNNPHFSKAVVHHELIPGHHLQQFMTRRYQTHRQAFSTPFWGEGWALYWELVLWDKGFAESPEDEIGMLYWRMHRCARIVFSLNYHLGNWSPQESIDYLVDKVGHEYANAEAEVRRSFEGNYGPLYQIAYMIGGMQFYALRQDLVESGKMGEKEFHDFILQNNRIPIAMVKALLTNEELNKEYEADWNFGSYLDMQD